MIKVLMKTEADETGPGRWIVGLGLSHKNLELLKAEQPIMVKLSEVLDFAKEQEPNATLNGQDEILIFAGETEESMQIVLEEMMRRKQDSNGSR